MWARGAAIRPVPKYAVIDRSVLDGIESELAECGSSPGSDDGSVYFSEFEKAQPRLAAHVAGVLSRRLDATAVSLGYFLTLAIWLAFHRSCGARLRTVTQDAIRAHEAALELERTIRAERAEKPIELEDVLQQEQPAILSFVTCVGGARSDAEAAGRRRRRRRAPRLRDDPGGDPGAVARGQAPPRARAATRDARITRGVDRASPPRETAAVKTDRGGRDFSFLLRWIDPEAEARRLLDVPPWPTCAARR